MKYLKLLFYNPVKHKISCYCYIQYFTAGHSQETKPIKNEYKVYRLKTMKPNSNSPQMI